MQAHIRTTRAIVTLVAVTFAFALLSLTQMAWVVSAQLVPPFIEPAAGRDPLISVFNQATTSLDVYVFTFALPADDSILNALSSAVSRNVTVRALLEPCPGEGSSCTPPNPEALQACDLLTRAGVTVKWANQAFTKTHAKTTLVDNATVLVTTINLEPSSFTVRRDYGMQTNDSGVVENFSRSFNQDWQNDIDNPVISNENCSLPPPITGDGTAQLYESLVVTPDNARSVLIGTAVDPGFIRQAQSTLQIQMEKLDTQNSRGVIPALRDAVQRGVDVKVLLKAGSGSAAMAAAVIGAGAQAQCRANLHAKMMIADGMRVFLGSQNLTNDSLDLRREIGWITTDAAALQLFGSTFDDDWTNAVLCTG